MKGFFYILFISLTVISSFGFKGCDSAYCEFLFNLNYATYGNQFVGGGDDGIHFLSWIPTLCDDSLLYAFETIDFFRGNTFLLLEGVSFYCAVGNSGGVVFSPDGGITWEDRSIAGLTENLYGQDFLNYGANGIHAVVCGESGIIYKSTNSGSSYIWEKVNTITTENLNSIGVIGITIFIAVGEKGTIIRSDDGGQTWENKSVGDTSAHFNRLFLKPSILYYNRGWAVADNGKIYATTDYGNNWFPQNSQVTTNLYDIIFRNENEGVIVGAGGVVRYTTNGGASWLEDTYFNGLTDGDIISIAGIDPNTATALIRGGSDNPGGTTMLTVSSEPIISVDKNDDIVPSEFSLKQNYPNPFNPSTTIQFSIPEQSFVKLEIFNSLGEKVSTLVEEELNAGNYNYEWNAENLSSGIYFYKLNTSDFVQSKKLVLMK